MNYFFSTNVPVEVMGFLNHPYPKKKRSIVAHEEVLAFFQSFATEFNMSRVIKFQQLVVNVRPLPTNRWEVVSKDLSTNICETTSYDAIFVCNGHYSAPNTLDFDGLHRFLGHKMHSHDYRRPDQYANETVLVIGAGPSGKGITYEITGKAKRVLLSYHRDLNGQVLPENVKLFGDIKCFTEHSVQFLAGEEEPITCILFCTGNNAEVHN